MKIPEIRDRLYVLAEELSCPELRLLADETRRRSPIRRATARWPRLSEAQKAEVRAMFEAFPEVGVKELADDEDNGDAEAEVLFEGDGE